MSDAAELLDDVETFLTRFVAYPSESAAVAHTLWVAHTWLMDCWESTPRIAFLSPEPGSGKSRCLEATEPLVPRAVHAVNASSAYLFRKVSDPDGLPTVLFDEIDTVFGPKAKENEEIRGLLNAGHRRGAVAGRCRIVGKTIETEELPAYCAVALAGLGDLPDTIMTRSVVVRMRRRAPDEYVEPWRARIHEPQGHKIGERLEAWAASVRTQVRDTYPEMPDGVEDRNADVWEALLAVADAAGGDWPQRARVTAVTVVTDKSAHGRASLGVALLRDIRTIFGDAEVMFTADILTALHHMDEAPWGDLRGKPLDARGLSRLLSSYDVHPKTVRIGETTAKGYDMADLRDPMSRYLTNVTDTEDGDEQRLRGQDHLEAAHVRADSSVTTVTPSQPAELTLLTDNDRDAYLDHLIANPPPEEGAA